MRRKSLTLMSVAALLAGSAAALPAQAAPVESAAEGGLSISLTTPQGAATETATGGFDVGATSAPGSGELELSAAAETSLEADLRRDYALFSDPIAVDAPFAVAGVTWDGADSLPAGSEVQIRMLDRGEWTDWYALEVEAAPEGVKSARSGTEYAVTGSSTGVQVRITKGLGDLPASLDIDIAYSDKGTTRTEAAPELADTLPSAETLADEALGSMAQANLPVAPAAGGSETGPELGLAAADEREPAIADGDADVSELELAATSSLLATNAEIQPRSKWGANEAFRTWPLTYTKFEAVVVHHTAGSNSYTQSQVPAVLSGIYYYHARTLGWGDIGYHVVLDKFGGRWEGRYGTLATAGDQVAVGGHAYGYNKNTLGISVMGDYASTTPSTTVLDSFAEVAAWKFLKAGVDPKTQSPLTVPANNMPQSTFKGKTGSLFPRIIAHLDTGATTCPASIYPHMWEIRQKTYDLYDENAKNLWLFNDVPDTHAFHDDIAWMVDNKLATGWPDRTFRPQAPVTREAFIRFIYRMAGEPAVSLPRKSPFTDISPAAPYYTAIVWAHKQGLAKGYADGSFRPQAPIQRDAVAAFLYRYAGSPKYADTSRFIDVTGSEHRRAIGWLATKGITTGWADGTFRPSLNITREATAAFLHRYSQTR